MNFRANQNRANQNHKENRKQEGKAMVIANRDTGDSDHDMAIDTIDTDKSRDVSHDLSHDELSSQSHGYDFDLDVAEYEEVSPTFAKTTMSASTNSQLGNLGPRLALTSPRDLRPKPLGYMPITKVNFIVDSATTINVICDLSYFTSYRKQPAKVS